MAVVTLDTFYYDDYDEMWYPNGELTIRTREISYIDFEEGGDSRFGRIVYMKLNYLRDYEGYFILRSDGVHLHNEFLVDR